MKTRIVAGLVASLVLFVSTGADAGPKKHRSRGATKPASILLTAEKAPPAEKAPASNKAPASPAVASGNTTSGNTASEKAHSGNTATEKAHAGTTPSGHTTPDKAHSDKAHSDKAHTDTPPSHAKAAAKVPGRSRFVASGVPLAEVRDGRLKGVASSKRPCGLRADWAKIGSAWAPLDAWGQVLSKSDSKVANRKLYEGSGCYEVSFQSAKDITDAPRLYVAKGSGYHAAPSPKWSPDVETTKKFEKLYSSQATAWVDSKGESEHGKVLFFHLPKQEGSPEGAPTQKRPVHWAVAGGRVLLVGYVGATGAWKVGHVLPPNGKDHAYEPIAVLDMNGDGMPEIVVHEEAGGVFTDRVLSFDAGTMRWEKVVESPGGASP